MCSEKVDTGVDAELNSKFSVNHVSNCKLVRAWHSYEAERINREQYVRIVGAILFADEMKKGKVKR